MGRIYLPKNIYDRMIRHEYLKGLDFKKVGDNPVCPKCERVALRDSGYTEKRIGRCPSCGYRGVMNVTVKEYAKQHLYE